MALRLFTKEEFEQELKEKLELTPTDECTDTACAWKTKSDRSVLVPISGIELPDIGEMFPDNWVAEIIGQIEAIESVDFD